MSINLIPMDEMGCWKPPLDSHELYMAVQKLKKWGEKSQIGAGNYHGEAYGKPHRPCSLCSLLAIIFNPHYITRRC
ncbi:hypothetical protein RRF57_004604 [Xylaria bambusicola]|uniref:Uncharacterized protein n=1 Tax=Xylaria bambusicola TaxID=326684 RepID=A0AAN7UNE5_9PEZI